MVKLNSALASRKGSRSSVRPASQTMEQFLKKKTHLHLQNKSIHIIEDLSMCKNLTVLYLQNNLIEKIDNLQYATNLSHLYLQNNKITKMENLETLKNLQKLYLGHNSIAIVEGIETLERLEELHLEKQRLPDDVELMTFDPNCVHAVRDTLRVLVVSGNRLQSLSPLLPLEGIRTLRASNNCITELSELLSALQSWPELSELQLQGNPVCSQQRYREQIIAGTYHALVQLDGKYILPVTRSFLQSLAVRQASRNIQPCSAKRAPPLCGPSKSRTLQLAVSSKHCARLPDLPSEQDQPHLGCLFPAWRTGKSRSAKAATPENVCNNWPPPSARRQARRKSCSSTSTDLSQHLHISRL